MRPVIYKLIIDGSIEINNIINNALYLSFDQFEILEIQAIRGLVTNRTITVDQLLQLNREQCEALKS